MLVLHIESRREIPPRPPRYWLHMLMSTIESDVLILQDGAVHNYCYVVTPFHFSRDVSNQSGYKYEFTSQLIKQQLS